MMIEKDLGIEILINSNENLILTLFNYSYLLIGYFFTLFDIHIFLFNFISYQNFKIIIKKEVISLLNLKNLNWKNLKNLNYYLVFFFLLSFILIYISFIKFNSILKIEILNNTKYLFILILFSIAVLIFFYIIFILFNKRIKNFSIFIFLTYINIFLLFNINNNYFPVLKILNLNFLIFFLVILLISFIIINIFNYKSFYFYLIGFVSILVWNNLLFLYSFLFIVGYLFKEEKWEDPFLFILTYFFLICISFKILYSQYIIYLVFLLYKINKIFFVYKKWNKNGISLVISFLIFFFFNINRIIFLEGDVELYYLTVLNYYSLVKHLTTVELKFVNNDLLISYEKLFWNIELNKNIYQKYQYTMQNYLDKKYLNLLLTDKKGIFCEKYLDNLFRSNSIPLFENLQGLKSCSLLHSILVGNFADKNLVEIQKLFLAYKENKNIDINLSIFFKEILDILNMTKTDNVYIGYYENTSLILKNKYFLKNLDYVLNNPLNEMKEKIQYSLLYISFPQFIQIQNLQEIKLEEIVIKKNCSCNII